MKKFTVLLMLLSIGLFACAIGCQAEKQKPELQPQPPDLGAPAEEGAEDAAEDDAGMAAEEGADEAAEAPAEEPAEGAADAPAEEPAEGAAEAPAES